MMTPFYVPYPNSRTGNNPGGQVIDAVELKRECLKAGRLTDLELVGLRDVPTFDEDIYPILMSPKKATGTVAHTLYNFLGSKEISDPRILRDSGLSSFELKLVKGKRLSDKESYYKLASYFMTIYGYRDKFGTEGTGRS